jgi:hypothetical protein
VCKNAYEVMVISISGCREECNDENVIHPLSRPSNVCVRLLSELHSLPDSLQFSQNGDISQAPHFLTEASHFHALPYPLVALLRKNWSKLKKAAFLSWKSVIR